MAHSDSPPVDGKYDEATHEKHHGHDVEVGAIDTEINGQRPLSRDLKSRHMQMIAIGGAIGAGLFVGSGGALRKGGPGSLVLCFMIVGAMLLFTVQALGELAVLYPVNGAFFQYTARFIDPAWGFAIGWDYAISWLTVLPFELLAAGITIEFWREDINMGVWIAVFLVILTGIQFFGVRGYGEVEFFLSVIKVLACTGFIILGVIIDCGGVPTDDRGYIGARYWHDPGAFRNGFYGFCSVFVTAAFSFSGTELVGLAAAEAADPRKSLPLATKQVFWRITFFYVVNLFILGLIVPSDSEVLLGSSGANTKASPFVLAIKLAGIKVLPSIFNAVITISVISVANSCAYGSSRTIQALALAGMAPKTLAYVDKHGRPVACLVLQIAFGCLAFIQLVPNVGDQIFSWLLALSGLSNFFIWGSICFAHIRFRKAWRVQGHSKQELPYQASFGVIGSWIGLVLNCLALAATFYTSVYAGHGEWATAKSFFSNFLAAFVILGLYVGWKLYTRNWSFFVRAADMDLTTGLRALDVSTLEPLEPRTLKNLPRRFAQGLF